jgi:hypothetical protein
MHDHLEHIIALLERTPGALDELLRGLPPEWTDAGDGENGWSPREVVAHLSHAESTDWITHLMQHGESQPFPTFHRAARQDTCKQIPMAELLDEFAALRAASLNKLRVLAPTPADMERCCVHQVLGKVTLANLLATWAAHDLTHLHQITRVMAHQVRDSVGPFSRNLGVLRCSAHSDGPDGRNPNS